MPKLSLNASTKTKRTPAGVIPVDWSSCELGEIVESLKSGVSVLTGNNPAKGEECGVLKVSAVRNGKFISTENKKILPNQLHRASTSPIKGSVIICRSNTLDLVGSVGLVLDDCPLLFLPDTLWQICFSESAAVEPAWINAILSSDPYRTRLKTIASGTSANMKKLQKPSLLKIAVPLPPLPEQRRISRILTAWDRSIQTLESLIVAKERRKKALMQQLLTGKKRLPGFAGELRKVRLNQILERVFRPIEWHADKQLSLVSLRRRNGGLFRRPDMLGSDYKTQDLHELKADDFLVSKRQVSHGAWGIVPAGFEGSHVSKEYVIFVCKDSRKMHMPFFARLAQTPHMIHQARVASTGVHIEKLIFDPAVFLRENICLPPTITEQKKIVAILDAADRELHLHRQQLDSRRLQKRGLMKKLLTGEIRLPTK